jgi:hypothetical protein
MKMPESESSEEEPNFVILTFDYVYTINQVFFMAPTS